MATRFVRVDLSEEARDYRPIAVEPGLPMLDRSGANARILFRWLGGMAAEPVWEDDLAGFYVRDDQGGRLEDVYCQPATSHDLQSGLRDELAKLRQRLEQSRGETSTERTLRKVLMRSFQEMIDNPGRSDQDSYFFKYKDVLGNWRLVWCWGYERLDQEPAAAVICTDPDCNLLFVRRPGKSPRCPACSGTIVPRKKKSKRRYSALLLLLLLLLLLGGLGIWGLRQPSALLVTPEKLSGAAGTQLAYHITAKNFLGTKDITRDAEASVSNPQLASVDRDGGWIRLIDAGTTEIEFRYRGGKARATVTATPSVDANELVHEQESAHAKQKPDWVKIFSQQGSQDVQSARFPVGAAFTDFKVEVHYPDGYTRFVTKKALLTTPEPAASALLTADHGKLTGMRPGKTKVSAEFQGIGSKEPLEVEVLADVDIDKIAIEPGGAVLRPGETYELHAIGYKNGQSIGDITGLGSLIWKSSNADVARIAGNSVVASNLGASQVTVDRKLPSPSGRGAGGEGVLTSDPAHVIVSNTIADELRVVPGIIAMPLGSSLQWGSDVQVLRGSLDVSQQASVVPESSGVVAFDTNTRSLRATNVGETMLGVTVGDKIARARVRVGGPAVLAGGKMVVEPRALILAPGQADRLTVYIETSSGDKFDCTGSAGFRADDPSVAGIDEGIARVRALKPGKTNIVASAEGMSVSVPLEVTNDEIKELTADPVAEELAVNEAKLLRVFGRADRSGLKEMFPQPDLKAAPQKPDVVDVVGDIVRGKSVGEDTIDVAWRDRLKFEVPTKVTANTITGLQIDPPQCTINTSQGKTYEVTGMRGGNRVILTERDGVQLGIFDPNVAAWAAGTTVISKAAGQTRVVATLGGEKAEATLNVTVAPPGQLTIAQPGVITDGNIYGPGGRVIRVGAGTIVSGIRPSGSVVGLRFEPDRYLAGVQAMPLTTKLYRQYENGGFDDVSDDANVKIAQNADPSIAKMEKVNGGWRISPVAPGQTSAAASFNGQTASLSIEINGEGGATLPVSGTLVVNPGTISLWSGQTAVIGGAMIDPGNGQPPIPVKVKLTAPANQGIVAADRDQITGRSVGDTTVTVTAENGQSTTINVHVTAPDTLSISLPESNLQVGQKVAPAVMAQGANGGEAVAVPAQVESLDTKVLAPDPSLPGQFIAVAQGQTQLHAVYRGKEAFAKVTVAGQRFRSVASNYNRGDKTVTVEVLAAAGEGELEYRVYEEGTNPKEDWVPNQPQGDARKAVLVTDPISADKQEFHLIIEARDAATKSVQKYPLTLVQSITYEQQNSLPPKPQPK